MIVKLSQIYFAKKDKITCLNEQYFIHFIFIIYFFEYETTIKKRNCNSRCLCLLDGSEGFYKFAFMKKKLKKKFF